MFILLSFLLIYMSYELLRLKSRLKELEQSRNNVRDFIITRKYIDRQLQRIWDILR